MSGPEGPSGAEDVDTGTETEATPPEAENTPEVAVNTVTSTLNNLQGHVTRLHGALENDTERQHLVAGLRDINGRITTLLEDDDVAHDALHSLHDDVTSHVDEIMESLGEHEVHEETREIAETVRSTSEDLRQAPEVSSVEIPTEVGSDVPAETPAAAPTPRRQAPNTASIVGDSISVTDRSGVVTEYTMKPNSPRWASNVLDAVKGIPFLRDIMLRLFAQRAIPAPATPEATEPTTEEIRRNTNGTILDHLNATNQEGWVSFTDLQETLGDAIDTEDLAFAGRVQDLVFRKVQEGDTTVLVCANVRTDLIYECNTSDNGSPFGRLNPASRLHTRVAESLRTEFRDEAISAVNESYETAETPDAFWRTFANELVHDPRDTDALFMQPSTEAQAAASRLGIDLGEYPYAVLRTTDRRDGQLRQRIYRLDAPQGKIQRLNDTGEGGFTEEVSRTIYRQYTEALLNYLMKQGDAVDNYLRYHRSNAGPSVELQGVIDRYTAGHSEEQPISLEGDEFKSYLLRTPEFRNYFVNSRDEVGALPDAERETLFTFLMRYRNVPGDGGESASLNQLFTTFEEMGAANNFLRVTLDGRVDQLPLPPGVDGAIDAEGNATLRYTGKTLAGRVQLGTANDPRHTFTLTGENTLGLRFPEGQNTMSLIEVIEQIQLLNPATLDRGVTTRGYNYLKDTPAFTEHLRAGNVRAFDAFNLDEGVPGRIDTQASAGMMRFPELTADEISQLQSPDFDGVILKDHDIAGTHALAFHMKDVTYIQAMPPDMFARMDNGTLVLSDISGNELARGPVDFSVGIDMTLDGEEKTLSEVVMDVRRRSSQ